MYRPVQLVRTYLLNVRTILIVSRRPKLYDDCPINCCNTTVVSTHDEHIRDISHRRFVTIGIPGLFEKQKE